MNVGPFGPWRIENVGSTMSDEMRQELKEIRTVTRNIAIAVSRLTEKMETSLKQTAMITEVKVDLNVIKGQLVDLRAPKPAKRRSK